MEVMPMTQARQGLGRRLRNGAEGYEETQPMDGEAAASVLFSMLAIARPVLRPSPPGDGWPSA